MSFTVAGYPSCPFFQRAAIAAKAEDPNANILRLPQAEYLGWLAARKKVVGTHSTSPAVFKGCNPSLEGTFIGGHDDFVAYLKRRDKGPEDAPTESALNFSVRKPVQTNLGAAPTISLFPRFVDPKKYPPGEAPTSFWTLLTKKPENRKAFKTLLTATFFMFVVPVVTFLAAYQLFAGLDEDTRMMYSAGGAIGAVNVVLVGFVAYAFLVEDGGGDDSETTDQPEDKKER